MTKSPSISVALCTFNGERFIAGQLESVFAQSLLPTEVIVADDASSDDTRAIVAATVARANPNGAVTVRVLAPHERLGVTANFQRAIEATTGELIVLCDQDDIWMPNRLERAAAEFAARPELTLLHGDARLVDDAGRPTSGTLFDSLGLTANERAEIHRGDAFSTLLRRNVVTGATAMFRRTLLTSALPFPEGWVHDEWLAIIAAAVGRVDFTTDRLIDYRQHDANVIGVSAPTVRSRVTRVLEPRGDRNRALADRTSLLVRRLGALPDVHDGAVLLASEKLAVEGVRADMPTSRILRLPAALRLLVTGRYARYCSQGSAEFVRDMLQPA
jgi:glycosyltransferase involved in cell wall biosynthesis